MESAVRLSLPLLPPEIRKIVLVNLPDLPTLRSAVLSHSCLNCVFVENRNCIIKSVVTSHVSPVLLPVALSALEASRIEPWSQLKVFQLLDRHHSPYICPPYQLTMHDAHCLEKMHSDLCFFARGFAAAALSKHPLTGDTEPPSEMTANEWHRISHNFYLFEFYCQLFRGRDSSLDRDPKSSPDFEESEVRDLYKRRHSFWEIEQQTCVYEYLYRELSKGLQSPSS